MRKSLILNSFMLLLSFLAIPCWADEGGFVGGLFVSTLNDYNGLFATDVMVTDGGNTLLVNSSALNPLTRRYHSATPQLKTFVRNPFVPGFMYKDVTYDSAPVDRFKYHSGSYLEITMDGSIILSRIDFVESYEYGYKGPGMVESRKVNDVLAYAGPRQRVVPIDFDGSATIRDKFRTLTMNCDQAETHARNQVLVNCQKFHDEQSCVAELKVRTTPEEDSAVHGCSAYARVKLTN